MSSLGSSHTCIRPLYRALHFTARTQQSTSSGTFVAALDESTQGKGHRSKTCIPLAADGPAPQAQTQEQIDAEVKAKLEEFVAGGGGNAGLELEGGKPVAMGRETKNNMFRVI